MTSKEYDVARSEDQDASNFSTVRMTERSILEQCKRHQGYSTPALNEKLYLHHFGFDRLGGLAAFTGCTVLYLNHNALTSLRGLEALVHLGSLFVSCNALASLASLPPLPSLRTLDVAENHLTSLVGLDAAAPQLQTLLASRNQLRDPSGVQGCTALLSLDVSYNRFTDAESVLASLRSLPSTLRTLLLHGNEVCQMRRGGVSHRKHWIVAFPSLKYLDEYPVFAEERQRAEAFVSGGVAAEQQVREAQRARADAEVAAQFAYFGAFRGSNRESRRRTGPATAPTPYFLANAQDRLEDEEEEAIYIPSGTPVAEKANHTDPLRA